MPIVCACEHPNQMYLQLRGLCPDTNLDRFYVPRNQEGAVILIGLKTSLISYDKVDMIAMCNEGKPMKGTTTLYLLVSTREFMMGVFTAIMSG